MSRSTPTPTTSLGAAAVAVAAGASHTYALLADGTVMSWGGNEYGQLGNGQLGSLVLVPPEESVAF